MPNKNALKKTLIAGHDFTIIGGPTAAAFVDALKLALEDSKATVDLYIQIGERLVECITIQVISLKRVGKNGDCYDFEAAVHDKRFGDHYIIGQYCATVPHGHFIVES